MVRGRKRDMAAPPTRQLTQQRDYRARKARYLSELEQRCLKAEVENVRLRRELELARAAMPFGSPQEVVQVSSELLRNLANASASIARFQQITAPHAPALVPPDDNSFHRRQPPISSYSQPPAGPSGLRPSSSPRLASLQPVTILPSHVLALQEPRLRPAPPDQILPPIDGQQIDRTPTTSSANSQAPATSPSPSFGSEECCGGYLDCTLLEEKEGDDKEDDDD
ncbi:hypothetical protein EDB19DRAFT_1824418 [Suillus lakei]|nr:hypothetical protein EDB19DRAFT_1824418 [Suillus lakei]